MADELGRGHGAEPFKGEGRAESDGVHRSRSRPPPTPTSVHLPHPTPAAAAVDMVRLGLWAGGWLVAGRAPHAPEQQRYLTRRALRSPEKQGRGPED